MEGDTQGYGITDDAFLEGLGLRNSRINDPSKSEYGPAMTGSWSWSYEEKEEEEEVVVVPASTVIVIVSLKQAMPDGTKGGWIKGNNTMDILRNKRTKSLRARKGECGTCPPFPPETRNLLLWW